MVVLIRGGGDLASGVALRLHRCGFKVVITELPEPQTVRRTVAFSEAVYSGEVIVEGVCARLVKNTIAASEAMKEGTIAVLVDPFAEKIFPEDPSEVIVSPEIMIDARMKKQTPDLGMETVDLMIGLGPGFIAGENCHAGIETNRGHNLGRVYWQGKLQDDTRIPGSVKGHRGDRVLRSPAEGHVKACVEIGYHLEPDQIIAMVGEKPVISPFRGVLRGLVHERVRVRAGDKIGDVDPRDDALLCKTVSDKSLAVGGGVLEVILSFSKYRSRIVTWD